MLLECCESEKCCKCCDTCSGYFINYEIGINSIGAKLRCIIYIIPVIIDIILTSIFFDGDNLTYSILRYVNQLISLLICYFCAYLNSVGGHPLKGGEGICCFIGVFCDFCVFCIIEITCLVFFILDFSDINLAQKIIYFFHWILIPYLYIMGKCLSY